MAAMNQPGCCPCDVTQPGCLPDVETKACVGTPDELGRYDGRGCLKCVPRYRCMRAVFTPSAYSTHCPATIDAKMFYTCEDVWVTQPETLVTVGLTLYRQQTAYGLCECFYRVDISVDGESETYEGIPLDELNSQTYGVSTDEGEYEITIAAAGVVRNPLAFQKCAPCVCMTCLPASLLVSIGDIIICPGAEFCQTVSLCATGDNSVTFELPEGDVTVTIVPSDDGSCGLDVTISATFGNLTGDGVQALALESIRSAEGCDAPPNLVECREVPDPADPLAFYKSGTRGSGSCAGWANIPLIDETFSVLDDGFPAFTVRVRDAACATCASGSQTCKGACPALESYGLSCTPPDLTAVIVSQCKSYSTAMAPQETIGIGGHPLQDGTIGTGFCQAFYSVLRTSPTSSLTNPPIECGTNPVFKSTHQFYLAMYYNPLLCSGDTGARPERYRLAIRFTRMCNTVGEPSVINKTVLPTVSSCDPPAWEFSTGITWGDLYGSQSSFSCDSLEKCCPDDQDEEIVIRVML